MRKNTIILYNETSIYSNIQLYKNVFIEIFPIEEISVINKDCSENRILGKFSKIECTNNQIAFYNQIQQILCIKLDIDSLFTSVILCRQILFLLCNFSNINKISIDITNQKISIFPLLSKNKNRYIEYYFTNEVHNISVINSKRIFEVFDNINHYYFCVNQSFCFSISFNDAWSRSNSVPLSENYIIRMSNNGIKFLQNGSKQELWLKDFNDNWINITYDIERFIDKQCQEVNRINIRIVFDAILDAAIHNTWAGCRGATNSIRLIDLFYNYGNHRNC
jgi:hypothetical protein